MEKLEIVTTSTSGQDIKLLVNADRARIGQDYYHNNEPRLARIAEGRARMLECLPVLSKEVGAFNQIPVEIGNQLNLQIVMRGNRKLGPSLNLNVTDRMPTSYNGNPIPPGKSAFISTIPEIAFYTNDSSTYVDWTYYERSVNAAINPPTKPLRSEYLWLTSLEGLVINDLSLLWMPTKNNPLHVRVTAKEFINSNAISSDDYYLVERISSSFQRIKPSIMREIEN